MKPNKKLTLGLNKKQLREFAKLNFQAGQQKAYDEEVGFLKQVLVWRRLSKCNSCDAKEDMIKERIKTLEGKK